MIAIPKSDGIPFPPYSPANPTSFFTHVSNPPVRKEKGCTNHTIVRFVFFFLTSDHLFDLHSLLFLFSIWKELCRCAECRRRKDDNVVDNC